jgi:hypothetical protein
MILVPNQAGPLMAHYMMAFTGGRQAADAVAGLRGTIKQLRKARTRLAETGVPSLPREWDVWAYDVIEGENAGLENPEVKEQFCSGLSDNALLLHLLDKTCSCTMGLVAQDRANSARYFAQVFPFLCFFVFFLFIYLL